VFGFRAERARADEKRDARVDASQDGFDARLLIVPVGAKISSRQITQNRYKKFA
jgi:hypothetical protein